MSAASPRGIEYPRRTPPNRSSCAAAWRRWTARCFTSRWLSEETRVSDYRAMLDAGAALGASRLAVSGDSADFSILAQRLAEMCDLARGYGIAVDVEFMPYRPVRCLADAIEVVKRAERPNAHILVDALHLFRSGSALQELARLDPAMIGTFQICDAPSHAPPPDELVIKACTRRLRPAMASCRYPL
jgi:sugar phosphate isomerase/epimerase